MRISRTLGAVAAIAVLAAAPAQAADPHRVCTKVVHVPASTKTVHDRVHVPARTIDTVVGPAISTHRRRVVTQSPRPRVDVHAPRFDVVTERVRTPARTVERHVPARTKLVRKRVLIEAARTVHKPCIRHGHHTTCAVHLPARYGTKNIEVVVRPARTEHVRIRGTTRYVEHHIQTAPATIERVHVGTQYRDVHVRVPEVPQHIRRRHVAGSSRTVARRVHVPGYTKRVPVPCH